VGSREDKPQSRAASKAIYTEGRWPTNVVLSHAEECTDKCVEGCPVAELDSQNDGSSRFFPVFKYQAKAPKKERPVVNGVAHPTVKPLELMKWLIRLVTPPGGIALSPFAGSGTCGEAAIEEGFMSILIEREEDYLPLIMERLNRAKRKE
jgi:site-specific DNA-methyltransferase (adenine-specific)